MLKDGAEQHIRTVNVPDVNMRRRTFLRRMINLLCRFRRDDHPIQLNWACHLDLTLWRELFQSWDGLSFLLMLAWAPLPDFQVSSDATGSLGFGAIFNSQWFFGVWSASQQPLSIAYKELFPIVVAAHLWGSQWSSQRVEFLCDNKSVVTVLLSGNSRDADLMVLWRYLTLLAVPYSFRHQFVEKLTLLRILSLVFSCTAFGTWPHKPRKLQPPLLQLS